MILAIYQATARFPKDERYGLTSQLRRAGASIGANLTEGCARSSDEDFARFVTIAFGSASEVEYFIILARDLNYILEDEYAALNERMSEVKRMLTGFRQRLTSNSDS